LINRHYAHGRVVGVIACLQHSATTLPHDHHCSIASATLRGMAQNIQTSTIYR
jgi:hypothetical protein